MNLWTRIFGRRRSAIGRAAVMRKQGRVQASPDAAQTTADNARHWANADTLSADAAYSKQIRERIRSRARYELQENNSYGKGIVLTLAHDIIGTGPRLQLLSPNREANQAIEAQFAAWAREIRLGSKLRTACIAKKIDGEAFLQASTNERLRHPIQLDVKLLEADRISTPYLVSPLPNMVDGVEFDRDGNPTKYHVLRQHPGDAITLPGALEKDDVDAKDMIHVFRQDRPGQHRGISEYLTALPLFAQMRRFTLATIAAAETAADFAGVAYTDAAALAAPDDWDAFDSIELEMRSMLSLPKGWKMGQMRAEHPATTHQMFLDTLLNEIARCCLMSFNVAKGNSAGMNFASGRMDHKVYQKAIAVERSLDWEIDCADRILGWWFDEAALTQGVIPDAYPPLATVPHRWYWDGSEQVDPQKEAAAQVLRLQHGITSYPEELSRAGADWEVVFQSQADALGITVEEYQELLRSKLYGSIEPMDAQDLTDAGNEQQSPAEAA